MPSTFHDLTDGELRDRYDGSTRTLDHWYAEAMGETDPVRRERFTRLHDRAAETAFLLAQEVDRRAAQRAQGRLFTEAA